MDRIRHDETPDAWEGQLQVSTLGLGFEWF